STPVVRRVPALPNPGRTMKLVFPQLPAALNGSARVFVSRLLLLGACGVTSAVAQTAPAPSAAASGDTPSETIQLSPFEVNTAKDVGFVATSALAGGRLATPLKDTPVAYSVLTKEFLDAFNVTDLTEAVQWSVNTTYNPGNNTDQGFGFSPAINI